MKLTLLSPLEGWLAPLTEVPDAVFADKMLGEGVAIDPTSGELCAPCDGEVIAVAKTRHAVTIRAANGAEILVHVGIDTVALQGDGFEILVTEGARVTSGQLLLRFDLDRVLRGAKSLMTPVLVTNAHAYRIESVQCNRSVAIGEPLFSIMSSGAKTSEVTVDAAAPSLAKQVVVRHAHGLHARPAAVIAAGLRGVAADVRVEAHGRSANAKSAVSLMALGIRAHDAVTVAACGEDAERALSIALPLLAGTEKFSATAAAPPATPKRRSGDCLKGVIASRGIALGRAAHLHSREIEIDEAGHGIAQEKSELERAREAVRVHLQRLSERAGGIAREVVAAHLEFIDDVDLIATALREIERGKSAAYGWRTAVRESARALQGLGDARMAERTQDLLDIEGQVLRALRGESIAETRELPENAILIAEDLKPSQIIALDQSRILGICTSRGGPTSHVAILAASMNLPALVALGSDLLDIAEETWLVLDAEASQLRILEREQDRQAAERSLAERRERAHAERVAAQQDARAADGERVQVWANLASLSDAQLAVAQGAEGCGLLRTEFLFLERSTPPDEREQLEQYQAIATKLGERPLTIRTLDIGGDKPVPYLPLPDEPNPALGLRGVRTSLWRPDLLRVQLRALLRVEPACRVRILIPMITDVTEIATVRSVAQEIAAELSLDSLPPFGAMIETPASALLARELAEVVDFFSIGTNDLTQYVLAMDREHSDLAARIDGLHPAVLRMIRLVTEAAKTRRRPVAVCGGLASDPSAAPILIGLGIRELSAVPSVIPRLKATIRALRIDECERIAERALAASTAEEVRALVRRSEDSTVRSSA